MCGWVGACGWVRVGGWVGVRVGDHVIFKKTHFRGKPQLKVSTVYHTRAMHLTGRLLVARALQRSLVSKQSVSCVSRAQFK